MHVHACMWGSVCCKIGVCLMHVHACMWGSVVGCMYVGECCGGVDSLFLGVLIKCNGISSSRALNRAYILSLSFPSSVARLDKGLVHTWSRSSLSSCTSSTLKETMS